MSFDPHNVYELGGNGGINPTLLKYAAKFCSILSRISIHAAGMQVVGWLRTAAARLELAGTRLLVQLRADGCAARVGAGCVARAGWD